MIKIKKIAIGIAFLGASSLFSSYANASSWFAEQFKNAYSDNVYQNTTTAKQYSTPERHVYSGGAYSLRTPNVTITPISATAPRFNVGCGGLDIYKGSFSYLTKDQLEDFGRAVLQNAPYMAFNIALEAWSPSTKKTLDSLQAMAQLLSSTQLDACSTADALAYTTMSALSNNNKDLASISGNHNNLSSIQGASEWLGIDATKVANAWKGVSNNLPFTKDLADIEAKRDDQLDANITSTELNTLTTSQANTLLAEGIYGNLISATQTNWYEQLNESMEISTNVRIFANANKTDVLNFVFSVFGFVASYPTQEDGKSTYKITISSHAPTLTFNSIVGGNTYDDQKGNTISCVEYKPAKTNTSIECGNFVITENTTKGVTKYMLDSIGDLSNTTNSNAISIYSSASKKTCASNDKECENQNTEAQKALSSTTSNFKNSIIYALLDGKELSTENKLILSSMGDEFKGFLLEATEKKAPLLAYNVAKACLDKKVSEDVYQSLGQVKLVLLANIKQFSQQQENTLYTKQQEMISKSWQSIDSTYQSIVNSESYEACVNIQIANAREQMNR